MSGETILVIDDSKEIVKHLSEYVLPAFGYKTIYAYDGHAGLQLIREKKPNLVMLDFQLPEMTGIDVLQQMAQESLSTPVVLMTGYGSEQSAIDAFRLGAKDYIVKPFTVDEIAEAIDRALVETRLLHDKEELAEQLRRSKVELSRQAHEMETLANIGKAITSLLSVDKVLTRVLEAARELTSAEESVIWLPDAEETCLQAYGAGILGDTGQPLCVSFSDSFLGQVMLSGRPLRQSEFSGQGIKLGQDRFARAVLIVPLKLRGVTLGVLEVSNFAVSRSFSKQEEFLLGFLADYAAIALENARVLQAADKALTAKLDELHTLSEIAQTITSSLDLQEVVRLTIQQVHDSWRIEASSLWWMDDLGQRLHVLANVGTPSDVLAAMKISVERGIVGSVARTGKWIYTNDVNSHPLHYKEADHLTGFETRSLLCVPLVFRGRVVGAMELLNKLDGDFDDQDVERALAIAATVAIAVTNALLFEEAESRKHQLEATMERIDAPILIVEENGVIALANLQARKYFDLPVDVVGQQVQDVRNLALLVDYLYGDADLSWQELTLDDGSVWLPRLAQMPWNGRILILQDITNLHELDRSKNHFFAAVSQDMQAPLRRIEEYVGQLRAVETLDEAAQMYVERIALSNQLMMHMVTGLLELARIDNRLEPLSQTCDLLEIITDVVQDFQQQALNQRVTLLLTAVPRIGVVQGNPAQLRRAISNLVDNAIKFSPPDANVEIVVSSLENNILIKVSDRGAGITEADRPHIFDKFYRGEDSSGRAGTGLGLALVHSIAEAHGGKIWVDSENGDGSTFFLSLPVV
jgi:two-component system NtrC family sensor kinase